MAYEFRLPDLGEGLTEAEIARWLVAEGEHVREDQPLVEVQTDKTTVEIPSPREGTVLKVLVGGGAIVAFFALLVHTLSYAGFFDDPITWVLLAVGASLAHAQAPAVRDPA